MKTAVLIPARYEASRLPGKLLLDATGKPLIRHTVENASRITATEQILVATDDERIAAALEGSGVQVVMTSRHHKSGTDRLAEAVAGLEVDLIVNLQGDEPTVDPASIDDLIKAMLEHPQYQMGTLATPIREESQYLDPSVVKVVCDSDMTAMYFSRAPIPAFSAGGFQARDASLSVFKHIGVYAYRKEFLRTFASWEQTPLEKAESLEQLRALEHGVKITVRLTEHDPQGINTPEDYKVFVATWNAREQS